jgi:hypothetical protein
MKQLWDAQELAEQWNLSFKDLELLSSKPHRNHLGFCSQLKYYQITREVPRTLQRYSRHHSALSQ